MTAKTIEGRLFDEIPVGATASVSRTLAPRDFEMAQALAETGDLLPVPGDAGGEGIEPAAGIWAQAIAANLVANQLPGPGARILGESYRHPSPARIGDRVTVTLTVTGRDTATRTLACRIEGLDAQGRQVMEGELKVSPSAERRQAHPQELGRVTVATHERHRILLAKCADEAPLKTAVVHPCDTESLMGAVRAAEAELIDPILVGPEKRIREVADQAGLDIAKYRIVNAEHSHDSAHKGVGLARSGEAGAVMKGSLHTDELMSEVMVKETGLRTARRISHVFVMDVPSYPKSLLITDAAINIYPTLDDKVDIVQNAIELAHALGNTRPKVAILSAVETVYPKIQSTLEAAALCKMADRGQIKGGILDGPLAFDNAISKEAAKTKKIVSEVPGDVDILLVPDLEAGNMLAKQLSFLAGADAAGIVLGARVPIILTSRADDTRTRLASCAVAVLLQKWRSAGNKLGTDD